MNISTARRIRFSCPAIPDNISTIEIELTDLLQGCQLSNFGKYATQLETLLAEQLCVKYVRTVPSATAGLMIVLSSLPRGSEVLVPSFTFPATASALIYNGLLPRFVEADLITYNIFFEDVAAKINEKTSAILAVHVFGNPCRVVELEDLARKHHLKLFFDAAAAMGSEYRGHLLGTNGDAEVFSLSGTKVVSAGEGGFIATNDEDLAQRINWLRNYGYNENRTDCWVIGFNGKLSELPAILALKSLDYMKENLAYRRELAEQYKLLLNGIEGVSIQTPTEDSRPNYYTMALQVNPDQFGCPAEVIQARLAQLNVETKRYFAPALHHTSVYRAFATDDLSHSEQLSRCSLCLPLHTRLQKEDVAFICEALIALHEDLRKGSKSLYRNGITRNRASVAFAKPDVHDIDVPWTTPLAAAQTLEGELTAIY